MADAARVVQSDIGKKVQKTRRYLSIRVRSLLVLAGATAVPVMLALVLLGSRTSADSFVGWLSYDSFAFFGHEVPLSMVALGCAWFVAVLCADALLAKISYDRIDSLLKWLRDFRAGSFARVPVLQEARRDEIGDLADEMRVAAARFLQAREHEKDISGEKSLFLTIAAHQLRAPLTALSWSIEALLDPNANEEARSRLLPQLNSLLKRMQLVVSHILASAKVEEGKFGFVFESVDIAPVIDTLIGDFRHIASDKNISLTFEHDPAVPHVYADTERISLALFDLIANAIDYTRPGGRVTVALRSEGTRVEVSITDSGIGIAAKDIPHLFTKFYRGDNARTVRPDGSGLGLYLVKNIVNNHGSEIVVQSDEVKGGSRFSFYLNTQKS